LGLRQRKMSVINTLRWSHSADKMGRKRTTDWRGLTWATNADLVGEPTIIILPQLAVWKTPAELEKPIVVCMWLIDSYDILRSWSVLSIFHRVSSGIRQWMSMKTKKGKRQVYLCSAHFCSTRKALRHGSHSFTSNYTNTCRYLVSVHQTAPPQTEVAHIYLQPTTHLSNRKGWKAELAWLADLQQTVYRHKWSPISCRSSAGQRKFAGQRPTFYHYATQPTKSDMCRIIKQTPPGTTT